MKLLDTIVPGLLHPSTVMYYPEIKLYANKPKFRDENFQVKEKNLLCRRRRRHQPGDNRSLGIGHPGGHGNGTE